MRTLPELQQLFPAIGQELKLNRLGADQETYEGQSVLDMRFCYLTVFNIIQRGLGGWQVNEAWSSLRGWLLERSLDLWNDRRKWGSLHDFEGLP